MKLKELEVRCLKKIKFDDNYALDQYSLEDFENNREYSRYINNLLGSINEGIKRLVIDEKIPYRNFEYAITTPITSIPKETSSSNDIYLIKALLHEDSDGVVQVIEFSELDDRYLLGERFCDGKIIIVYAPKIRELTKEDETSNIDLSSLGLNDLAIGFLTYFVKCELFEELEPDIARQWRSYADSYMSAMTQELRIPTQKKVKQVIRLGR